MTLAAVVFCQMANVLNCRTQNASVWNLGVFSNHKINIGIFAEFLILIVLMYVPLLQDVFQTGPLNAEEWLFLICIPIPVFFLEEFRKKLVRHYKSATSI